ncbi:MAG: hypothetical protein WCO33_03905, partial [bacterium]
AETPAQKKADRRFDDLLAAAKKDPKKTDWKALRRAFADTSHYDPYNLMWNEEMERLGESVDGDDLKEAEKIHKVSYFQRNIKSH